MQKVYRVIRSEAGHRSNQALWLPVDYQKIGDATEPNVTVAPSDGTRVILPPQRPSRDPGAWGRVCCWLMPSALPRPNPSIPCNMHPGPSMEMSIEDHCPHLPHTHTHKHTHPSSGSVSRQAVMTDGENDETDPKSK